MYTIGEVSKMFNIPISTIRYYDKEGFFSTLERKSGIRKFSDKEINELTVITCLKQSGLEIKEIKNFMKLCSLGKETYNKRYEMFLNRKKQVLEEIDKLKATLAFIEYKCWYYETAIKNDGEEEILKLLPNNLPEDIQKLYDKGTKNDKH